MPKKYREGQFTPKGTRTKYKQTPVSVLLPEEIDPIIKALPNRSEFIRQAIIEKLQKENIRTA